MKQERRPLAAGSIILAFAVVLLLFLNYAKFGATLESRERTRHALLAEHLAKILEARLALGLQLEDSPTLHAALDSERRDDARLLAIAAIDTEGSVQIQSGEGQPALWRAVLRLAAGQNAPVQNEATALAVVLHNSFGAPAGWLVLEYDLRGSKQQAAQAFGAVWPLALPAFFMALLLLAAMAPRIARRYPLEAGRAVRRLSLLLATLMLLVQCVISWSAYHAIARTSSDDAPRLAATLAHTLTPGIERALSYGIALTDLHGVEDWLRPVLENGSGFAALGIEDLGKKRLFSVNRAHDAGQSGDELRTYRYPLRQHGQTVGSLAVTLDLLPLAERTRQLAIEFATLLAIGALIGMEVLHGVLSRSMAAGDDQPLLLLRLPLFLSFAASELPRAFLPMWSRQLAQQPLPKAWSDTPLAVLFAPFANLPESVATTLPISLFLLSIAMISPFAGRYSARHGPIRLLQIAWLLALLGHLLALFSESLLSLSIARVLAGASSGCMTVAAFDYIGRGGARARGLALYLSAYVAAGICGAGLGALLVDRAGTPAVFAAGIVCTLLAGFTLHRMPAVAHTGSAPAPLGRALNRLLRQPHFMRLLVLVGLPMQILQQGLLFYWVPMALTELGQPTSFVGLTMMLYFFLVLLLNAAAARWADRSGRHAAIVLAALMIAGVGGLIGGVLYNATAITIMRRSDRRHLGRRLSRARRIGIAPRRARAGRRGADDRHRRVPDDRTHRRHAGAPLAGVADCLAGLCRYRQDHWCRTACLRLAASLGVETGESIMSRYFFMLARALALGGGLFAATAPASATETAAKVVFLITNRGCEEVCLSFQRNLESQGPVRFIWRDVDGDVARTAGFVAQARELHPDLIATWGTGITLAVAGPYDAADTTPYIKDIPVVYMYVGNPVESKIARDARHSGRPNIAGANTAVPIETQVNLLASYRKLNKVGMLYNTNEPAAVAQAETARQAFEARGVQVAETTLALGPDGKPVAGDIPAAVTRIAESKPDFLYYIGSTFTLQQIATISGNAMAYSMPIFSSTESAFRKGELLLGLISPLASIGQVAAYQAGQILFNNKQAGELATPTITHHSVLINMKAARKLRLYPPMKLLQFAEITE